MVEALTHDPIGTGSSQALLLFSAVLFVVCVGLLLLRKFFLTNGSTIPLKDVPSVDASSDDNDSSKPRLVVLYGTQTGTAESFSKIIGEEARMRYGSQISVVVMDLDAYAENGAEYEEKLATEALLLVLIATYGDGEPTDSAVRFHKWLTEQLEKEEATNTATLPSLSFAVFGLGNRQYEHFNAVGKVVDKCLAQLGASRLIELGLGDDDKCIEDDFAAWREALWPQLEGHLQASLGREYHGQEAGAQLPASIPEYHVELHPPSVKPAPPDAPLKNGFPNQIDSHHPIRCPVVEKRELHTEFSERSCIHLEFDITSSCLTYETGDHVGVFAENSGVVVQAAAECLGLPLNTVFSLRSEAPAGDRHPSSNSHSSSSLPAPFPTPTTIEIALARYADLLTPPRKGALLALAEYAGDASEAERLKFLASSGGKEEYAKWVLGDQRSLLEVMQAFPSAKPPLGVFFAAVAPRLQPRYYSISSSPRQYPGRIHVTCAVVRGNSPTGRLHEGVASTWMERAVSADASKALFSSAPIFVRPSSFKLPFHGSTAPIVMVGPGTGLAPFRGFLQERAALLSQAAQLGEAILFFGCRDRQKDYIYRDELEAYEKAGVISRLHIAFSREGGKKDYVQHQMLLQAKEVWRLLASTSGGGMGGYLYVCGDAKSMAKDVHRTIRTIVQQQECVNASEAEEIVKQMQHESRYLRDVW